jgi:hypothetical protein
LLAIAKDEAERENIGTAMQIAFQQAGLPTRIFTPCIAQMGASLGN